MVKKLLLFLGLSVGAIGSSYTYASDREFAIKAGLIYNFAVFSEGDWFDPTKDSNYLICSADKDFVRAAEKVLKSKSVHGRSVLVKHLFDNNYQQQCHTVFYSADINTPAVFPAQTMIIGETTDFIDVGGHISFFIARGRVRFEVSPSNLTDSGIKLSSKVLRLGKVKRGGK